MVHKQDIIHDWRLQFKINERIVIDQDPPNESFEERKEGVDKGELPLDEPDILVFSVFDRVSVDFN